MSDERDGDRDSAGRPAPLEDLARELDERRDEGGRRSRRERQGQSDAADSDDPDPFEEVDVEDVDREELWRDLFGDEREGDASAETSLGGERVGDESDASGGSARGATDARERVVAKRSYCEQCPHFSAPPEAVCENEGTEIVEMVSLEQFRVRNCPMVDD